MWSFPHPETAIPLEEPATPAVVVPTGELSTPDEKSAAFFEKKPKLSFNSTRLFGSKLALFFRKNPLRFCGLSIFLHSPQIFCGLFRERKLPLSTPRNESNLTRNWDIFEKMWLFPHPETAILPLERLSWGSASSYRRIAVRGWDKCHIFSQKSQFLVKFDSFFGVESGIFSLFLGTSAGTWDDLPIRVCLWAIHFVPSKPFFWSHR